MSIRNVVDGGYCVGCGACEFVGGQSIVLRRDSTGRATPSLASALAEDVSRASSICPFSNDVPNEDVLAQDLFPGLLTGSPEIGRYNALLAGRICDKSLIMDSSSGGLTTWLLRRLLREGLIDAVIHVGRLGGGHGELFAYRISRSDPELLEHRKSQYYSCSMGEVLRAIKGRPGRFAVVGVPCYIKAVRLLANLDPEFRAQIAFCVSLVCGHMKTRAYAELLSWQLGLDPSDVGEVDFRVKVGSTRADTYSFSARSAGNATVRTAPMRGLLGHNWGHALFQLKACDYCDDIFGELADVSFGDAWLDRFTADASGTNIVVVRNEKIRQCLLHGQSAGEIDCVPLSEADLVLSQEGNFRHRREGLSVRIHDAARRRIWAPRKRAFVDYAAVSLQRRFITRLRENLAASSHLLFLKAKNAGGFGVSRRGVRVPILLMRLAYRFQSLLAFIEKLISGVSPKNFRGS